LDDGELIHFEKMTMIYESLSVIKKYLGQPYAFCDIALATTTTPTTSSSSNGSMERLVDDEVLVEMCTVLPHVGEKELYEFKGDKDKEKVNELMKAYKNAMKRRKEKK